MQKPESGRCSHRSAARPRRGSRRIGLRVFPSRQRLDSVESDDCRNRKSTFPNDAKPRQITRSPTNARTAVANAICYATVSRGSGRRQVGIDGSTSQSRLLPRKQQRFVSSYYSLQFLIRDSSSAHRCIMHENVHQRKNGLAVHTRSGLALGSRVPSRPSLGK